MIMNKTLPSFALCVLFAFLLSLPVSAQVEDYPDAYCINGGHPPSTLPVSSISMDVLRHRGAPPEYPAGHGGKNAGKQLGGGHLVSAPDPPDYVPGVVVVQFEPDVVYKTGLRTGLQEFDQKASRYGVHAIERMFPFLDYAEPTPETAENIAKLRRTYSVHYSAPTHPERVAEELELAAGVTYTEPILLNRSSGYSVQDSPNDLRYPFQAPNLELVGVPDIWEIVKGEDGIPPVVIAIVDTGADWEHEDLLGNVWVNEDEVPGNGLDDDENGFIDDVHGVFFGNGDDLNNDPGDATSATLEHGTSVAGVAGAVTDNFLGIAGVAWNSKIMHVNASTSRTNDKIRYGYQGIVYAAMNGADIINASWGAYGPLSGTPAHISEAIELATDMGALIVAAAGNDGQDMSTHLPASHPLVLAAGASSGTARREETEGLLGAGFYGISPESYSNFGPSVLFAPGTSFTTFPNDQYKQEAGTSIAAPFISGVAALVKTRFPDLTPRALRNHLLVGSRYMGDRHYPFTRPEDFGFARGFIDAEASVTPAPRIQDWGWTDSGDDDVVSSGDVITITATVVNYLADSEKSVAVLVPERDYWFLSVIEGERAVRSLGRNDSMEVSFRFKVAEDVPVNRVPRFHIRVMDIIYKGISFHINPSVEAQNRAYEKVLAWGTLQEIGTLGPWITRLHIAVPPHYPHVPPEIGELPQLSQLYFNGGGIGPSTTYEPVVFPIEVEQLENLIFLGFNGGMHGIIPPSLKKMTALQTFFSGGRCLDGGDHWIGGGSLPRSFLEIELIELTGGACMPNDSEFQAWAKTIPARETRFCSSEFTRRVPDQAYYEGEEITPVTFPGAPDESNFQTSGRGRHQTASPPIVYTLQPTLPEGLTFNAATRTISGTPVVVSAPVTYTYTATDANLAIDTLTFSIEVLERIKTSTQRTALPESFAFHGNYPNPFRSSTRLQLDLPWAARVAVEVLDVTGRRVHVQSPAELPAGWNQFIALRLALPAGVYLYRLTADTPEGLQVRSGRFVKVR